MLARQVGAAPRRWPLRWILAVTGAVGAAALVLSRPPTVVVTPPVIAVIEAPPAPPPPPPAPTPPPPAPPVPPPPPPPAPEPPPEPVAAIEPPVIGTRCVRDLSTVGLPMAQASQEVGGNLRGVAAAPQGCTLAAWADAEVHVSWDGGQTFARLPAGGAVKLVAVAAERVAILRGDGALGVVRRGESPVWRALPRPLDAQQPVRLFAAGPWIAVTLDRPHTKVLALTDDDGATWRYLTPPPRAGVAHLDPSGVLTARVVTATSEPDGEHLVEYITQSLTASLRDPIWRKQRRVQGSVKHEVGPWTYTLEGDKFWGCGGSSQVVAARGGRRTKLLGDIRPEIWPFNLVTNGAAMLAMLNQQLLRIEGARAHKLVELPIEMYVGELVAVDGAGTAITRTDQRVLRWSARGGWRVLLDVSGP